MQPFSILSGKKNKTGKPCLINNDSSDAAQCNFSPAGVQDFYAFLLFYIFLINATKAQVMNKLCKLFIRLLNRKKQVFAVNQTIKT
ncbi:hypothetical protein HA48_00750 [Pantoea wallisii]|uniref:Uncharacterized protein n=1 Tax=Pantoea wallisii TaxID=1076551 RepID=A0A1X1DEH6_9GAMM|nr:hypothetical protein HA48_00750 [Pantoea wallisii]